MRKLTNNIRPSDEWVDKANDATDKLAQAIVSGETPVFDKGIYGDKKVVRPLLREISNGKCSYCESDLSRQDGDVEHYRPKARVNGCPKHPGYWWLAYDWDNLLIACQYCNQFRKGPDGSSGGKGDHFPVENESQRCIGPDDPSTQENPLLLNPRLDDPSEHLVFDMFGQVHPICDSERGAASIEHYHLNHPWLVAARLKHIRHHLSYTATTFLQTPNNKYLQKQINELCSEEALYSQVAQQIFDDPSAFGIL